MTKQGLNTWHGITHGCVVQSRVAVLIETRNVCTQLKQLGHKQLPAGAGVIGALFAVFVILLVTDILGLTDVYPFTR